MPYDYNFPFQAWDDVNLYSIQLCQMKLHQIWMCNFSLQGHSFKVKGFNLNTFFCVQLTYDILESVHSRSKARSLVLDAWKNCMIHHKNQILNQVGVVVRNSQSCWPENELNLKSNFSFRTITDSIVNSFIQLVWQWLNGKAYLA